jgi:hypothetical protein
MVPLDNKGRVDLMKDIAFDFVEPFRSLVEGIPQTAELCQSTWKTGFQVAVAVDRGGYCWWVIQPTL